VDVEELLDRFEQPTHRGTLPSPPARTASATNPRCGDSVTVFALVSSDRFERVRFEGAGCTISQAAADVLAELAEGQLVEQRLELDTLLDRLGRTVVGSRLDCASVGLRALHELQF
jgi:nitrogen fixation protein NifU and related proteins